jgi:hypothetical protein
VLIWNPESDRWSEISAAWSKRAFHTLNRISPTVLVAAGGFAEEGRIHADLVRFQIIDDTVRVDEVVPLGCPRVAHQAFTFDDQLVLWGGTRCEGDEALAPEHWSIGAGLQVSSADRWGSEANLHFASSVELRRGTFMILGGALRRDGALQTPNRENSFYYLASSQKHVRAPMLPEGTQNLLGSAARLSGGRRAMMAGGFADPGLNTPREGFSIFEDEGERFMQAQQLPGMSGSVELTAAGQNQVIMFGGAKACSGCVGYLEVLSGAAVYASAEDH